MFLFVQTQQNGTWKTEYF